MKSFAWFRRIAVLALAGTLAACGGGGGGQEDSNGAPATNNTPPVIAGAPPTTAKVGQEYLFEPNATDPDGDVLTFAILNRPEWATFSPTTGRLRGTPPANAQSSYPDIQISVTDGKQTVSLPAFRLSVESSTPQNTAPTISGTPATTAVVGNAYEFTPTATDPDGQTLRFEILNVPSWASFDSTTGRLSGTPAAGNVGTYSNIRISVTDGTASVNLPTFTITVSSGAPPPPSNRAPTISGTPAQAVTAGTPYLFRPQASDPDGQSLTFAITNRPAWASFDAATGELGGTPGAVNVGQTSNIVISVTDGQATASLPAFSITVTAANRAPTIGGSPATSVTAGQAYSFTPAASDADGQALTYSIVNRPSWATFSTSTGRLSGTPTSSNVGTVNNIVISVTDGQATASLPPFSITVTAANRAPTISGSPATSVTAGQAYSFTPTASDPDSGQTLTFSITGRPSWATFSTSTGRLSGTPASTDVGTSSNIVISVSDGSLSAALPAFSIAVTAAANRAPTISGTPSTSVTAGQAYSFTPTASDPDSGQTLRFGIANAPSWASFDIVTGRLSGTPTSAQVGTYSNIVISVSDGSLSATLPAFSITVADVQTGSATLRWTPPTLNEDGSPITNLRGYRVYYGTSSTNLSTVLELANPGLTSAVVENLSPATWYFAVKAYNTANVESALSNIASKTIR